MPAPENVAALILAGGAGIRLHRQIHKQQTKEKWALELAGTCLLDHVVERVKQQTCRYYFCVSPQTRLPTDIAIDQRINDPFHDRHGPLPALCAGLTHLTQTQAGTKIAFGLGIAVDTPFFPTDFVARATALNTDLTQPIVGHFDNQPYPTCTLWPLSLTQTLTKHIAAQPAGSIFQFLNIVGYHLLDYSALTRHNPFFNINTFAQFTKAQTRMAQTRMTQTGGCRRN